MARRLFVAFTLPEIVKEEIAALQDKLKARDLFSGSYTRPESLHLTLKFLGDCDGRLLEHIKTALLNISFSPVTVTGGDAGTFTQDGQVRVVWVELNGADELQRLVDNALSGFFKKETRFMGHITIARPKRIPDKEKLKDAVKALRAPIHTTVHSFSLIESRRLGNGHAYTVLCTVDAKTA